MFEEATLERITESDQALLWRLDRLMNAGYEFGYAQQIAVRTDIDLHVACDLVKAGCPDRLAFEILS